jgi:hypothetical protein
MTTAQVIFGLHVVIGAGAGVWVIAERRAVGGLRGPSAALLMVVFWPFFLPMSLLAETELARVLGPQASDRARRIEGVAAMLAEAWSKTDAGQSRERAVTEGFVDKLRRQEARRVELESTASTASVSIRPQLEKLIALAALEIDQGLELLEEMTAQLTLLRFAGIASGDESSGDKDRVLGLLARIEALANMSNPA